MYSPLNSIKTTTIQPKPPIGAEGNPYGMETDGVPDFMEIPTPQTQPIQRKCETCDEEEVQMKPLTQTITPIIQKQEGKEEEETVQMKGLGNDTIASSNLQSSLQQSKGGGQSLDTSTQSFMSRSIGADFSNVKVHTDGKAIQMNRQLNAKAFTNGSNIYFNQGQYNPKSVEGKHLLVHELTHVVQQNGTCNRVQKQEEEQAQTTALQSLLPGYTQQGDTCGAASLVTALIIYDRESGGNSNEIVLSAINVVQTWMIRHQRDTIEGWNERDMDGQGVFDEGITLLNAMRTHLITEGSQLTQTEYQMLGIILYALYIDGRSGLSSSDIWNLQNRLGLTTDQQSSLLNYSDLFTNAIVSALNPGQIAQIGWLVRTGPANDEGRVPVGHHAFIIGRFQNGEWFLSDQGVSPAAEFTAATIEALEADVSSSSSRGEYWIYMGSANGIMGWTGVRLLAGPDAVTNKSEALIAPGTELAEIDAGRMTIGDTIVSGDFVVTAYSRSDALQGVGSVGTDHGAVLVEMPRGVFFVYETNTIRTPNMLAPIDTDAGGLLTRRIYYSAELMVSDGNSGRLIEVY